MAWQAKNRPAKQFGSPALTGQKFWPNGGLSPGGRVMSTHDPLPDRLTVEAMATALDMHGVDPRDDTAVVQTLQRVGYRAAVIGRLMDRVEERAWHLRTLRLYVAPRMRHTEPPTAANEGTLQGERA